MNKIVTTLKLIKQTNLVKFNLLHSRSIMSSSNHLQKAIEQLEKNPYYDKYAEKIAKLQATSPDEFLERVEKKEREEIVRRENAKAKERQYSSVLNPKPAASGSPSGLRPKQLSDVMKIDLIQDKSPEEIKEIWEKYHVKKDVIAAIIPRDIYEKMNDRIQKYPVFLFPLPRSAGYEFIMCQFATNTAYFTPLLCYQVHKENAPECLNIVHYTELMESKGIVLMKGEFDPNVIDGKEAQCLANQLQMYYGQDNDDRQNLLNQFTNNPNSFKHMDLIKQLENISLAS